MKIVVCVKSVKANLFLENSDKTYALNPYDVYALKQCQKIKNAQNAKIVAIMMGRMDKRLVAEIRKLGADQVVVISDKHFAGADTLATTYVLAEAIKQIGSVDYVVCGDHAIDGETGHVGAGLAERLDYDYLNNVVEFTSADGKFGCITETDEFRSSYEIESGIVCSIGKMDLKDVTLNLMQLRKVDFVEFELWDANTFSLDLNRCGMEGSRTRVVRVQELGTKNCRSSVEVKMEDKIQFSSFCRCLKGGNY